MCPFCCVEQHCIRIRCWIAHMKRQHHMWNIWNNKLFSFDLFIRRVSARSQFTQRQPPHAIFLYTYRIYIKQIRVQFFFHLSLNWIQASVWWYGCAGRRAQVNYIYTKDEIQMLGKVLVGIQIVCCVYEYDRKDSKHYTAIWSRKND